MLIEKSLIPETSYLVAVAGKTNRSKPLLYWPRTNQLRKVKQTKQPIAKNTLKVGLYYCVRILLDPKILTIAKTYMQGKRLMASFSKKFRYMDVIDTEDSCIEFLYQVDEKDFKEEFAPKEDE